MYYFIDLKVRRDRLITKFVKHIVGGKWKCTVCDYVAMKGHVFEHVESKHIEDGQAYKCRWCRKSIKSRNMLRVHATREHPDVKVSVKTMY